MRLLAPAWLALGAAAALALVALHLLAIGRPPPFLLPTARFVPERPARARRLARRPSDRLLLAARVAAVLLGALALARPTRTPTRRTVARLLVADRSRAVADLAALRDSVRALAGPGDVLVVFDTVAAAPRALGAPPAARDSAIAATLGAAASAPAGSLSAALAAARRAAPRLRDAADSIELVLVSALTTRELDAATHALRAAWGGRARVVRVRAAAEAPAPAAIRVVWRHGGPTAMDDALAAAAALAGARSAEHGAIVPAQSAERGAQSAPAGAERGAPNGSKGSGGGPPTSTLLPTTRAAASNARAADPSDADSLCALRPALCAPARIVRDGLTAADSAWARDSGGVLVDWPGDGMPRTWRVRAAVDTSGAVVAGTAAFVAPMARRAAWPTTTAERRVIARWADGESAATEGPLGAGCVREVAVPVPQVGDAALRPPFHALLASLTVACARGLTGRPLDSLTVRALAGRGPLLATAALGAAPAPEDPLARWLLSAAIALLAAELPLRLVGRRRDAAGDAQPAAAEAA